MNKQQQAIDVWFKEQGWEYWKPHEILARLAEEVGDILYTLACFANTHDIDLDAALKRSLDKVAVRDKDRFNQ